MPRKPRFLKFRVSVKTQTYQACCRIPWISLNVDGSQRDFRIINPPIHVDDAHYIIHKSFI